MNYTKLKREIEQEILQEQEQRELSLMNGMQTTEEILKEMVDYENSNQQENRL